MSYFLIKNKQRWLSIASYLIYFEHFALPMLAA